jgi:hypothetical protein
MRYYPMHIRRVKIQTTDKMLSKTWNKLSFTTVAKCQSFWNSLQFLTKLNVLLPCDLAITFLGIDPNELENMPTSKILQFWVGGHGSSGRELA